MYCKHCGAANSASAKFCKSCGKAITPAATTSEHIPEVKRVKRKINKKAWWISAGAVALVILVALFFHYRHTGSPATTQGTSNNNSQSVVDIWCDNGQGGSGVIFTSDGTVLTNNHVITGATTCQVTIPNPETGGIAEIYDAAPVITPTLSKEYDIATLKIDGSYTDASGTTWGAYPTTFNPFILPSTCNTSTPSQLGDAVRIYGYPVTSGGYNLTETDGIISSFEDDGDILTSAKIDSGNSGGLAVDQNGCWLGLPSAVVSGNYQNLGVIIPGSIVEQDFLSGVPAKYEPIAVSSSTDTQAEDALSPTTAAAPQETNDQVCQDSYGTYSQWSGNLNSSGNPTCVCQTGYSWDGSGNECATQISLQQQCVSQFGSGSYSYTQAGKAVCGCDSSNGYVWNSDQTACVQETNTQICQNNYGSYSISDGTNDQGGPSCSCQSGYTWNSDQTACIAMTPDQLCAQDVGAGSYYLGYDNSDGSYACSSPD